MTLLRVPALVGSCFADVGRSERDQDVELGATHRQGLVDIVPLLRDGAHLVEEDAPQLHDLGALLLAQPQRPLQARRVLVSGQTWLRSPHSTSSWTGRTLWRCCTAGRCCAWRALYCCLQGCEVLPSTA